MIRGVKHLSCEEGLRQLDCLAWRRKGFVVALSAFQYPKEPAELLERDLLQGPIEIGQGGMDLN